MNEVPFCLLKKVIYVQDSEYKYHIDEDGYGYVNIDGISLVFYVNEYGEILAGSIRFA